MLSFDQLSRRSLAAVSAGLTGLLLAAATAVSAHAQTVAHSANMATQAQHWRGIVKAVQQPTLSSELSTPIASIGFREGERFSKGQSLLEFDCRRQQQEAAALAATVREMLIAVDTNAYLTKRGASNANDVEVARARHDKAKAEHGAMLQRLSTCSMLAPFDGVVTALGVAAHETPPAGKPLMSIASTEKMEIELIVPSRALLRLQPGAQLSFTIDETGKRHNAIVVRLGGAVDPVSQTAKVFAALIRTDPDVLPGMSGTAVGAP